LNSQNERVVGKEDDVRNATLVMNSSSNGKPPLDETKFNKKIQKIVLYSITNVEHLLSNQITMEPTSLSRALRTRTTIEFSRD